MHLVENDLLQEVQPDIVSGRAFTQSRIMVLATEKLDVMVILIKMEVQIAATLGTLHHAGKTLGSWVTVGRLRRVPAFSACTFSQVGRSRMAS